MSTSSSASEIYFIYRRSSSNQCLTCSSSSSKIGICHLYSVDWFYLRKQDWWVYSYEISIKNLSSVPGFSKHCLAYNSNTPIEWQILLQTTCSLCGILVKNLCIYFRIFSSANDVSFNPSPSTVHCIEIKLLGWVHISSTDLLERVPLFLKNGNFKRMEYTTNFLHCEAFSSIFFYSSCSTVAPISSVYLLQTLTS